MSTNEGGSNFDPNKSYDGTTSVVALLLDTNAKSQVAINLLVDLKCKIEGMDINEVKEMVRLDFERQIKEASSLLVESK